MDSRVCCRNGNEYDVTHVRGVMRVLSFRMARISNLISQCTIPYYVLGPLDRWYKELLHEWMDWLKCLPSEVQREVSRQESYELV